MEYATAADPAIARAVAAAAADAAAIAVAFLARPLLLLLAPGLEPGVGGRLGFPMELDVAWPALAAVPVWQATNICWSRLFLGVQLPPSWLEELAT